MAAYLIPKLVQVTEVCVKLVFRTLSAEMQRHRLDQRSSTESGCGQSEATPTQLSN